MTLVRRSPGSRRRQRVARIFVSLMALSGSIPASPRYLGPNKCTSCHDHEPQKAWSTKDKHSRALQQLEDPKASKYASAIGLSDPYDLKGSCVTCHATIFGGDANAGVSCETCHGPGSEYLEPHQQKGTHVRSVSLGMIDTRGNYPVWAALCVNCHIVTDRKLTAAGHKSGADFEVGAESRKIVHWKETYDFAKLSAAGRTASARRGGGAPPQAAAAPKMTPSPVPTKPPKPTPTAAPPAKELRATPPSTPVSRPEAARPPTPSPPRRESPAPTAVPREVSTPAPSPPPAVSPEARATERPSPAPPEATRMPATRAAPSDILILIEATPIPTTTPRRQERAGRPSVPSPIETGPPTKEVPAPGARVPKKARPKAPVRVKTRVPPRAPSTAVPAQSPPSPRKIVSPTPTRVRAPVEPPRRPPH